MSKVVELKCDTEERKSVNIQNLNAS